MNVELVSRTVPDRDYFDRYARRQGFEPPEEYTAEELMVYIARVSSSRDNKLEDHAGLLRYLIGNSHWSPFQHAYMTLEIQTSRAIARQYLRHRSFDFQETSHRYQEADGIELIETRRQAEKK